MIRGGALRSEADRNDPSFHRSFGTTAQLIPLMEYNYDVGKTLPDQNGDGYFMACTGYTLADIAGDEDDAIYKHQQTYDAICEYYNHPITEGGQIRDAANFGCVMGLQRIDEMTDAEALQHRRGRPFSVDKVPGLDWFDSFRIALRTGKRPISTGTIWFQEWNNTPSSGILTSNFVFDGTWDSESGHNYKISGERTLNGEPHLSAKTWQGKNFGDNGWCYFDRQTFNKAFDIYGTLGLIQPAYSPQDILYVKLTILQRIVQLIARYVSKSLVQKVPQFYA